MRRRLMMLCAVLVTAAIHPAAAAGAPPTDPASAPVALFDFTRPETASQWTPSAHAAFARQTAEGAEWNGTGPDPYLTGPAHAFPPDQPLRVFIRLRADTGGTGQLFHGTRGFTERDSVRFPVPAGEWTEVRLDLPPLGPRGTLRLDPPGAGGRFVVAYVRVEKRALFQEPSWPGPDLARPLKAAHTVRSGPVSAVLDGGEVELRVAGTAVARRHAALPIGYETGETVQWLSPSAGRTTVEPDGGKGALVRWRATDAGGAAWCVEHRWTPGRVEGTLEVDLRVTVSRDRAVVFLPLLVWCAGEADAGTHKGQALLAGLEYLEDEPSSSEADVRGPASRRRVPADYKLTFPLMTLQANGRYAALAWDRDERVAALFDSPDRTFGSGRHLMGLLFPGCDGRNRTEGALMPNDAALLRAGEPLVVRMRLLAGQGGNVTAAVRHWTQVAGIPAPPASGYDAAAYLRLAAHGWLESGIREGPRFRHAVWSGLFGPQPAVDAAFWMDWLAQRLQTTDSALATQLRETARAAREGVAPEAFARSTVGHVRTPAPLLTSPHAAAAVAERARQGHAALKRFERDGYIPYLAPAGGPDYGSTHFEPEANGLAGPVVKDVLESALISGDAELKAAGLRHLRALNARFGGRVPRGAQTWEIPLHTPDILAAAHLIEANVLGHELTGEAGFLHEAEYWAWTGLPLVYLDAPRTGPVGLYGTIAVLGATNWQYPVWLGQPVQWCGLVYAEALFHLARHEAGGPWRRVAEGIAAASLQITWPVSDRARGGLLPDYFVLPAQQRDGPAINPATLQGAAARLFGLGETCTHRVFLKHGVAVVAPGNIEEAAEDGRGLRVTVAPALDGPCTVLFNGLAEPPAGLRINGRPADGGTAPHTFDPNTGRLFLVVEGRTTLELRLAP